VNAVNRETDARGLLAVLNRSVVKINTTESTGGTDLRQVGEQAFMAEFTFLKLQFDDASFSANAPFSASGEAEVEAGEDDDGDEESGSVLPLLLGLVFLVGVAIVVKKLLGGGADPPDIDVGVDAKDTDES
jgi:hypothetical protein